MSNILIKKQNPYLSLKIGEEVKEKMKILCVNEVILKEEKSKILSPCLCTHHQGQREGSSNSFNGKPYGNVGVMERRLVNSFFNQWCGFSEIFLIGLKGSIGSELVWITHSWWWMGPFWPRGEVININHQLFSFIATSFHSCSLEWKHFHTASYYTKEQGKPHKTEGFISTRLVPNHNTWRNP